MVQSEERPIARPHPELRGKLKGVPKRAWIVSILLVALITFLIVRNLPPAPTNKLRVSGRIEGYETNIGAKIGGRINYIAYREGAAVHKGETIVRLDDSDIQAQLRGALARIKRAQHQYAQADAQLQVVQSQIREGSLNVRQASEDMIGRIEQGEANVAQARAQVADAQSQLAQAKAQLELTKLRHKRFSYLADQGAVSRDEGDQATTNFNMSYELLQSKQAMVAAAMKQLQAQEGLLKQARSSRLNPPIRTAQLAGFQTQLLQAQQQLLAAGQDVKDAAATRDQILANIAYLNIQSPVDGVVTARTVEPGAVVAPGQTVLALLDFNTVYLRAYVPEGEIGKVRIGQAANIYLDSAPNTPLAGRVIEIDPQASFTPENIYFREDRVKQVFGVRIAFDQPRRYGKPGMPADADIFIAGKVK